MNGFNLQCASGPASCNAQSMSLGRTAAIDSKLSCGAFCWRSVDRPASKRRGTCMEEISTGSFIHLKKSLCVHLRSCCEHTCRDSRTGSKLKIQYLNLQKTRTTNHEHRCIHNLSAPNALLAPSDTNASVHSAAAVTDNFPEAILSASV